MQNHSGEHVISGLIYTTYGYENVGFHLGDGEMTMDISGVLTQEQLVDIENRANAVVWSNAAITAEYPEPEVLAALPCRSKLALTENVRIVTIEGVDACACCAPHVARTGEIGIIRIVDSMNYKGGMRLWVLCGADALTNIRREHDDLGAIGKLFSTGRADALRAVEKLQQEHGMTRGALGQSRRALMLCRIEQAASSGRRHLLLCEPDGDAAVMRYAAEEGAARCEGVCFVFTPAQDGTLRYVCAGRQIALRSVSKQLNASFSGRGGGSDVMIQGSLVATDEQIYSFLDQL
jgi:alanyl-tRNA synthetase